MSHHALFKNPSPFKYYVRGLGKSFILLKKKIILILAVLVWKMTQVIPKVWRKVIMKIVGIYWTLCFRVIFYLTLTITSISDVQTKADRSYSAQVHTIRGKPKWSPPDLLFLNCTVPPPTQSINVFFFFFTNSYKHTDIINKSGNKILCKVYQDNQIGLLP